ncbi:methyl-accepting chemotaxis protein [Paenibacillus larvae]|uniref:Methyl-accepting chemotaxis protein n=3 Tax=Paenibacillus larvae TaxID=1464 RepID=A0AAP5JU31_9BACL|nr:methyl-accepting chemotaxis protein [Paenibacillus larvae]AVF20578.1 methyl-accepting chemotaxis protein TlpB [Paenibacillus larvae subsp. larvae]ETK28462.1 methyl-accepting chemotaxis protein TlpB [Paenibacillus larvae subsp. larvae DSM 25719]MCY9563667.1 methyl-accepting chemotaxis protein [Paenibacillus larvae]MCY9569185.1 methyl-accepting chemotaxis protein [Paenibacillus larvae]MCY9573457.1 methyl-accepting chemotaxis protein [Paenibacillus larvae]
MNTKRTWRYSIKIKLIIAFMMISLIPVITISIITQNITKNNTENIELENMSNITKITAQNVDDWFQKRISLVEETIKKHPEFKKGDKDQILSILNTISGIDNEVESYSYTDTNGVNTTVAGQVTDINDRNYYKKVKETRKPAVNDFQFNKHTGSPSVVIAVPLMDGDELIGTIQSRVNTSTLMNLVKDIKIRESCFGYLLSANGVFVTHNDKEYVGKNISETLKPAALKYYQDEVLKQDHGYGKYLSSKNSGRLISYHTIPTANWKMVIYAHEDEVFAPVNKMTKTTTLLIIIVGALILLISIVMGRFAVKPLLSLSATINRAAQGDLTPRLQVKTKDEVGQIAKDLNQILGAMSQIIGQVHQASEQVAASSEELTAISVDSVEAHRHVTKAIEQVMQGSETKVQSVEQSSTAMEEMAGGIQRIAESSSTISDSMVRTAQETKRGNEAVQKAVGQMRSIHQSVETTSSELYTLGEHTQQIDEIITAITAIAEQTQLLSLNASIEAARAGEAGRGFAVVAEEVKKLAEQSATSAQHIAGLVGQIQSATKKAITTMNQGVSEVEKGSSLIDTAGAVFEKISAAVEVISDQVREVSAATEQMSASSEEVSATLQEVVQISQNSFGSAQSISAASEEQLASMEEISASSRALSEMAQELQETLTKFKA